MGDPELRSDEKVLVRTPGVYVKSIPFEGILTNKRIILVDRAKNLLPPKEIPLVTIKEVEPGENAIRDQIVTLSVMAKTGETRQMILTFSRQAGGNRIKERDAWVKIIRENASSSYDQVIRKVIPGPEPVVRRTEPAQGPRYEIVHSPVRQPAVPASPTRAGPAAPDEISPVRRAAPSGPAVPVSPPVPARPAESRASSVFCSKCGNEVPAESVFCNRCGSPIARVASAPAPVQAPAPAPQPVPAPVPPAPPSARVPSARPIDDEIQSIEPLIERSPARVPADPLRSVPAEVPVTQSVSWDEDEEPAQVSPPAEPAAGEQPAGKGFMPRLFSAKSGPAPEPSPAYGSEGDAPPPPKPPRRALMPGKQTILTAAAAVVVILLVAAGGLFVYPMLSSGNVTESPTPVPTSSSSVLPSGTIVIKETPAPEIPATGVFVHVNYLGGFKGSYGIPEAITTVPGNSGDRVWEVENATNTSVQATFEKLDGSSHELLVEIYRDGKLLSGATTTVGHGSVSLSVDMVTGIAAAPVTSGGGTVKTAGATAAPTASATASATAAATTAAAATTTEVTTTVAAVSATATTTTESAVNTTTAAP